MNHLDELEKLGLPKEKFVIYGSGPLAIRGLKDNDDIDIIVKKELWDTLVKKYQTHYLGKHIMITVGHIDISKDCKPFSDVDEVIDRAEIIGGFRYMQLKDLLSWKECMNREKDKKDIKILKEIVKKEE